MADTVTLATLKRQCREHADQETGSGLGDSAFVDDTELIGMINATGRLWHAMVVHALPEAYELTQTISSSWDSVSLPADHYKTLGVRFSDTNSEMLPLRRVQYQERHRFTDTSSSHATGYYLKGSSLVLLPTPTSGTYYHDYVRTWTALSDDADSFDAYSGWDQWIVYDVAIKMLLKEESDVGALLAERQRLERDILAAAADREFVSPMRVIDTRTRRWFSDPDFGNST